MSEVYCPGGAKEPTDTRDRDMPRSSGSGLCPQCGEWIRLTAGGLLRRHKTQVDKPRGFTPADEDLKLPPEGGQPDGEPKPKTNPTPDLSDEEYLEQMALIAQAISVMPAQREGLPNITTPPPIRPLWARFMLSLGLRIHPEVATHKLRATGPAAAGNFGPRQHVQIKRDSMNRDDLLQAWKEMNPETFQGIQAGTMTREALLANMPEQMKEAVRMAEELREKEQREQQEPPAK